MRGGACVGAVHMGCAHVSEHRAVCAQVQACEAHVTCMCHVCVCVLRVHVCAHVHVTGSVPLRLPAWGGGEWG